MTTAVAKQSTALAVHALTPEQVDLIKRTICKDATDDELMLFINQCNRTGLDPFSRQIYGIKRWNSKARKEEMAIQMAIDGFRLVAERTERYAPGREPSYTYDAKGNLESATAYVKKLVAREWHEVAATAFWTEYAQTDKDGNVTRFWARMPRLMLAKCAEALALRKAFPLELSGIYTDDEMGQADSDRAPARTSTPTITNGPQPAPGMLRMELQGNLRRLAEEEGKTFDAIVAEFCQVGNVESLDKISDDRLLKACESVLKRIQRVQHAKANPPQPVAEREPGIDDEDDPRQPDIGGEGKAPEPAKPTDAVWQSVRDQFTEAVKLAGFKRRADFAAVSEKAIGRKLPADFLMDTLTLDELNRGIGFCQQVKKDKLAAAKLAQTAA